MRAVAGDVWAQDLHILAARLKSRRRGRDPHQPPARLQHVVGAHLHFAANGVEHDVAIARRLGEILRVVVDRPIGAEALDVIVVAGAGGGDHGGAQMLGQLDPKSGHTSGAALDQDSLAGFELGRVLDCPQRGQAGQPHRRRLGMAEPVRLSGDDRGLDRELFGIAAFDPLIGNPEHRVSDLEVRHARPDCTDHPGKVAPENMRQFEVAVPAPAEPDLVIGGVDAGRVYIDDDFAQPGNRVRRLAQPQHLRSAMRREQHRLHRFLLYHRRIIARVGLRPSPSACCQAPRHQQ